MILGPTVRLDAVSGNPDGLAVVALRSDDRRERRTRNVFVVEGDIDAVNSRIRRQISHGTSPVSVIPTIDGSFAGTLDSDP